MLLGCNLFSDDWSNARGISMGKASMVSSTGVDAYGLNPANFDYREPVTLNSKNKKNGSLLKPKWEVSFFSVGGGYGSDTSIEFYDKYLNYLSIDRNKFASIFTSLPKILQFRDSILPYSETEVNYDFELRWFSVNFSNPKFGTVNLAMTDRVGLNTIVFSRDEYLPLDFLTRMYVDSSGLNLVDVNLAQSEAIAWWIRKYSIGYAKQFDYKNGSFAFGLTASLIHGFGNVTTYESRLNISSYGIKDINGVSHVDTIKGKQDFHTQSALTDFFRDYKDGHESKFNLFPSPAGIGYSFDIGITLQVGKNWKFAASVTDLGKISWDYNTITNNDTNYFAYYDFYVTGTDPTYNRLVDDLGGYHTQDTGTVFKSDTPVKFHAGILYKPSDKFLVEVNWSKGTNNLPGNSDKHMVAVGTEYYPFNFLPIRAGASIGGPGKFHLSLGTGIRLKNFSIDIGAYGLNQIFANKRYSLALSSKIMF